MEKKNVANFPEENDILFESKYEELATKYLGSKNKSAELFCLINDKGAFKHKSYPFWKDPYFKVK